MVSASLFIFAVVFAVLCYLVAQKKGYNTLVAVISGFFFGLIALIVYLCLKSRNKKKPSKKRSR